jgi:hypothetical protein
MQSKMLFKPVLEIIDANIPNIVIILGDWQFDLMPQKAFSTWFEK